MGRSGVAVNRRLFLLGGMAAASAVAVPAWANARTGAGTLALPYPFTLGVASGDPAPDSVVLWTRLAPTPLALDGFGGMPDATYTVRWAVYADESLTNLVQDGYVATSRAVGHSVHVIPRGLQPGREYFYRFHVDGHTSPVGRTRTSPAGGAAVSQLKFCFASCQHFEEGWYHAHRGMLADNPDLVVFLGDYIYEKPSGQPADLKVRSYVQRTEATALAHYRVIHGQYRTDPNLRGVHAAVPWVWLFDDHEVDNNWNMSVPDSARKTAAFKAFYENMPLRVAPSGASIQQYRRLHWGNLARFHLLDTRQYRTPQAASGDCDTMVGKPDRTLTGDAQERWLLDAFTQHPATWDLIAQQVFFAQRDDDSDPATCANGPDAWDGYVPARRRIAQGWVDRDVPNPVVLTGDVHRHWAADLRLDYDNHSAPVIGSELVTTSATSYHPGPDPGPTDPFWGHNPHVKYARNQRGYVRATVTPSELRADFVTISNVREPDPAKVTISTHRSFAIEAGTRGLTPA